MKKVVIIGGGFAGIALARKLDKRLFDVTIIDKNNYHQFQPLLYQVAISGIEPGSICFPLRGVFGKVGVSFILANVESIDIEQKCLSTSVGEVKYDYLVIAAGTTTNFFGNSQFSEQTFPMKNTEDALWLRSRILQNLEEASLSKDPTERKRLLSIAIVGGGATGVEIAGALAELKRYVIPRDFPELAEDSLNIHLIEGSNKLLGAMSEKSSAYALKSLQRLGINVVLGKLVTEFDGRTASLKDGSKLELGLLIWVSGVTAIRFNGIPDNCIGAGGRIITNLYSQLESEPSVFAIGDIAIARKDGDFIRDPQVAPVAIQQAKTLAKNLVAIEKGTQLTEFRYKNPGAMATIGRNKAVADINGHHLKGFFAWLAWLVIHLRSILGVRNKIIVLVDWIWNYFSFGKSTGLIMFRRAK